MNRHYFCTLQHRPATKNGCLSSFQCDKLAGISASSDVGMFESFQKIRSRESCVASLPAFDDEYRLVVNDIGFANLL
jgi:hypothetical protein